MQPMARSTAGSSTGKQTSESQLLCFARFGHSAKYKVQGPISLSHQLALHLAAGSHLGRGDEQEEQQAGGCNGEEEQQDQRRAGEEREPGFQVFYQTFSESSLFIQVPGADDKKSFTQLMN